MARSMYGLWPDLPMIPLPFGARFARVLPWGGTSFPTRPTIYTGRGSHTRPTIYGPGGSGHSCNPRPALISTGKGECCGRGIYVLEHGSAEHDIPILGEGRSPLLIGPRLLCVRGRAVPPAWLSPPSLGQPGSPPTLCSSHVPAWASKCKICYSADL